MLQYLKKKKEAQYYLFSKYLNIIFYTITIYLGALIVTVM